MEFIPEFILSELPEKITAEQEHLLNEKSGILISCRYTEISLAKLAYPTLIFFLTKPVK
jgi:hypothetical protein